MSVQLPRCEVCDDTGTADDGSPCMSCPLPAYPPPDPAWSKQHALDELLVDDDPSGTGSAEWRWP